MNELNSEDATQRDPEHPAPDHLIASDDVPKQIGRYKIQRLLGKGGFGRVYLAYDEQLGRQVAVKLPHAKLTSKSEYASLYLAEARAVAQLDHPHIVPVYDVGCTSDYPCYIVSRYIEGTSLATYSKQQRIGFREAATIVSIIAEALHYAHKNSIVHRDIKPGNILIGPDGKPCLIDFGMALRDEEVGRGPKCAGTPAYMSPEQARGEGHRVDGRSDVFSLGIVFYELLVGRRPFRGDSQAEVLEQITNHEPRPPVQYDEKLPKELQRICLKALARRASDRYSSAYEMAEDLRAFLAEHSLAQTITPSAGPSGFPQETNAVQLATASGSSHSTSTSIGVISADNRPIRIVPKGLRSFDAQDADFFLELLPGPRDRDGLPNTIRFWKTRIEETDSDNTFAIGLIYGPSGCGKSSLFKAGLLPRLSTSVIPVYLEATPNETESRLLRGLRKRCPEVSDTLGLKETIAAIRLDRATTSGRKVLIVLDQFEQWLHANKDAEHSELVQALRQCHGGTVQCILMVRDDFWLSVSRFLRELEVPLLEGQNSALADLFDLDHARKVLSAFGRAFGKLPENPAEFSKEQKQFVSQAVSDLARERKVVCVRLALFAEMMKSHEWTPASLKEAGGAEGVGVMFLEETFSAATAPPDHRYHQKAARNVLRALLPESGADIKGHMRSYEELLEASGYKKRSGEFERLIRMLDSEMRLVTPIDPRDSEDTEAPNLPVGQRCYQLAHDYLVHSLRDWLTRKQRETRHGRALLLLEDRAGVWAAHKENRHLPASWEYVGIRLWTKKSNWTTSQAAMMRSAMRVYGLRAFAVMMFVVFLCVGAYDLNGRLKADSMVRSLVSADTSEIPQLVEDLNAYRRWAIPLLRKASSDSAPHQQRLHASMALSVDDPNQSQYLSDQLLAARPEVVPVILGFLGSPAREIIERYWKAVEAPEQPGTRLRAAGALARFAPQDPRWQPLAHAVAADLIALPPVEAKTWIHILQPASHWFADHLKTTFRNRSADDARRSIAAAALSEYRADSFSELIELILLADSADQYSPLRTSLARYPEELNSELMKELATAIPAAEEAERNLHLKRKANAVVALIDLSESQQAWETLKHQPDLSLRSYVILRFSVLGLPISRLIDRLKIEQDVAVRRAIILGLGRFEPTAVPPQQHDKLITELQDSYRNDSDPGVHSAIAWTLQRWNRKDAIEAINEEVVESGPQFDQRWATTRRNWYVNKQGQTFVVIPEPRELRRPKHRFHDTPDREEMPDGFCITAHEVTVEQFCRFLPQHKYETEYSPLPHCPINYETWYHAAAYCNWLNESEDIPRDQWCYEPNEQGQYAAGMKVVADWRERIGYRLATNLELEYLNRANTMTRFGFGSPLELLDHYDWYVLNSETRSWPVGSKMPNDLGAFDVHGNAWEWCHDGGDKTPIDDSTATTISDQTGRYVRNGVFFNLATTVASHERTAFHANHKSNNVSFRIARRIK